MAGLTKKRGKHYTLSEDGTAIHVAIDFDHPIQRSFAAEWTGVEDVGDSAKLLFAQVAPGNRGTALLAVRISGDDITSILKSSADFVKRLLEQHIDGEYPEAPDFSSTRYQLEHANVMHMGYSGKEAHIDFYEVPLHDRQLAALSNGGDRNYWGPQGVVSVSLATRDLVRLISTLGERYGG